MNTRHGLQIEQTVRENHVVDINDKETNETINAVTERKKTTVPFQGFLLSLISSVLFRWFDQRGFPSSKRFFCILEPWYSAITEIVKNYLKIIWLPNGWIPYQSCYSFFCIHAFIHIKAALATNRKSLKINVRTTKFIRFFLSSHNVEISWVSIASI